MVTGSGFIEQGRGKISPVRCSQSLMPVCRNAMEYLGFHQPCDLDNELLGAPLPAEDCSSAGLRGPKDGGGHAKAPLNPCRRAACPKKTAWGGDVDEARKPDKGKIRVLICDDHTLFRAGLKAILGDDPMIEVVGEAADGRQAVQNALRLRPDIVLMDTSLPLMAGYEALRRITKVNRNIKILVLTMYSEEEIVGLSLNSGASGYILKDASAGQLIEAIHIVHEGGTYLSPRVAKHLVNLFVQSPARKETRYDTLSDREREILKLLADGYVVKDIASLLNLSVKTVEAHKYNLMRKLDIHNKTELIKYAIHKRLIESPTVRY